jgi:hypothetical protein
MTSTPNPPQLNIYSVDNASISSIPFTVEFRATDPLFTDVNFPVQKIWLNTVTDHFWFLKNFYLLSNNYYAANWIPFSSSSLVELLQGNTGAPVPPNSANTINVPGDGTYITTVGNPSTNTLTIEGIAGAIVASFEVDTSTPPGTDPVTPNSSGVVTVTGGQVAAGTTANVIQTDSLALNTYTIQVQRSQAVASSTIADNGVCHFNSADFTVDSNGFVSALGATLNYTNVNHGMSPYTVLAADYYISVDCSGGTVTLNFPNAPTFKRLWIIKDRTGSASTNNISMTTPGGTVTFDGLTTYVMAGNYDAVNLLANSTPTYEVY